MLRKPITYTDFNNVTKTEDFYFNLSKAEIVRLILESGNLKNPEADLANDMASKLQAIVDSGDGKAIMQQFRDIILMAYGERSEDGSKFRKSKEISDEFSYTGAYDALFLELITDPDKAATWINGLMPPELAGAASAEVERLRGGRPATNDHRQAAQPTPPAPIARIVEQATPQPIRPVDIPVTINEAPGQLTPHQVAGLSAPQIEEIKRQVALTGREITRDVFTGNLTWPGVNPPEPSTESGNVSQGLPELQSARVEDGWVPRPPHESGNQQ